MVAIALLLSCNAFSPRDSEEPKSGAEWNSFPTQPEQSLQNLEYAFEYSQNSIKYGEIFPDGFSFFFDTQDISDYGVPETWDAQTEEETLLLLYNHLLSGTSMSLELTAVADEPDEIQNEIAEYYRDYRLSVQHDLEGMPDTFEGTAYFQIIKNQDGLWRIAQWRDYRKDQQAVTWGRLKYEVSP